MKFNCTMGSNILQAKISASKLFKSLRVHFKKLGYMMQH